MDTDGFGGRPQQFGPPPPATRPRPDGVRLGEQTIPADALARVAALLNAAPYRFARTMPTNPHWYTLRREWEDVEAFRWAVHAILVWGYPEDFYGTIYRMLDIADPDGVVWKYWTCGNGSVKNTQLINRKPLVPPAAAP